MRRLLAPFLLASALAAQTSIELQLPERRGIRASNQVYTQILHVAGPARKAGYGYTRIYFQNRSDRRRVIDVRLSMYYRRDDRYLVRGHLELEGKESGKLFLPIPFNQSPIRYQIDVDGVSWENGSNRFPGYVANSVVSVLCVTGNTGTGVAWKSDLTARLGRAKSIRRRRRGTNLGFQQIEAQDLPDRWVLLSGFDLLIVDAASDALTEQQQATLANYVAAGGSLIVLNHATLAKGPLYRALEAIAGQTGAARGGGTLVGTHDFGHVLAFGDSGESFRRPGPGLAEDPVIAGFFSKPGTGALWARERPYSGPATADSYDKLHIPGLNEVPVRLFFFLILGFAVLVGPVNWTLFVKRKKQPMMLLATIPITGIGFATVILSWGVISEGFGLQGNIRSLILLDQRSHAATVRGTRTIYAGLSPAKLAVSSDTYLYTRSFPSSYAKYDTELVIDNDGSFGGGALPSRVEVTYATATRTRARDRLRFKKNGTKLSVLADDSFAPVRRARSVLLCDFAGKFWIGQADGSMKPATRNAAAALQRQYLRAFRDEPVEGNRQLRAFETRNAPNAWKLSHPWMGQVTKPLAPGSYLAWVNRFEGEDDFGLHVEYAAFSRLVRGTLAEEDIF